METFFAGVVASESVVAASSAAAKTSSDGSDSPSGGSSSTDLSTSRLSREVCWREGDIWGLIVMMLLCFWL